ncbi:cytochrome P450 [Micromonospora endophytica]|uniref:Cytochrome P450 n=1 Tax=Micromonospora endophytica TaxID=515350 RepID=A0A2W2C6T0_9ACTN|nr:cytochrome P450 [Micromonospora endophytica]PZF93510.1 cytochrome P450 [Micromonospora endophytica]RIW40656.1 cytochrome P450 [Micromonospora endophytica]
MSVHTRRAGSIPLRHVVPSLMRDPARALVEFGDRSGGEVVKLNLGSFRPYLITHPDHLQRVLREKSGNYVRAGDGLQWRPLKRLFGEGILSDGEYWTNSRQILQPLFTARRIDGLVDRLAVAIEEAIDELAEPARTGQPVDMGTVQAEIVCSAIMRVFFDNKITVPDAMRIMEAQDAIAWSVMPRIMVPWAPNYAPMPGDRTFRRAVQLIDDLLLPTVRAARDTAHEGADDIISTLWRGRTEDGGRLDERQVRNDTVAMVATTTETTISVLTWLWPHIEQDPTVATRLYEELDRVVGDQPVRREHLRELRYLRQVLDELLRLYPIGWLFPRRAVEEDVIGGVRIPAGATLVVSPLITQRMSMFWDRPEVFDPDRFSPEASRGRPKYAHFPFGGGPHQCLGMHLFYLEATLIVATLLSRFRFRLRRSGVPGIKVAAALRPLDRVEVTLRPVQGVAA